jgi:hypothetical protein
MAVVFWNEVYRQYEGKWRAPSAIMDLVAQWVNSRIVEHEDLTNPERNWLMNIDFLVACDTVRLKYHGRQQSKNNNADCQKLTTSSGT